LPPGYAKITCLTMPSVSVIMVFHRDTPFLRLAISSVLAQTFRDFELILIDNGLGITATALGDLGADSRVRWVHLARDEGIGVAANAGVAVSRGEFIAIMDYDDFALPNRFERQVAALRADPAAGLVSALADRIDGDGRMLAGRVFTLLDPGTFLAYAQYAAPVIHPVVMGRREVFLTLPFRPQFRFTSELDFYARAVECWRLIVLPEVLLHYRCYPTQTTQRYAANIEQSRCTINLLTSRRRAGRSEDLASITWMSDSLSPADYCRGTAARCVVEGFCVPAAYLARRSFALERSLGSALKALGLGLRAWLRARSGERRLVARMFFTGPVKALDLRPA
jgi:hypothetical protein